MTPTKLLNLDTCFGQNLRKLVYDGAPLQAVYGADLFADYERVGHALFRDANTFENRFIAGDLFDEDASSASRRTEGTWDVISVTMFLHVFDWDLQVRACKCILRMLSKKPGSLVIGAQTGSVKLGELVLKLPLVAEGERKTVFRQSSETFKQMWEVVGREEDVRLKRKSRTTIRVRGCQD